MEKIISFDGLGIGPIQIDRVAFSIGGLQIYWYAVIIACGLMLAVAFCMWQARKFDLTVDNVIDVLLFGLPAAVICARAYYVIFRPAGVTYDSFAEIIDIRNGGLAIYGGIIGAFVTGAIYCRVKRVNMLALFDLGAMGFLIGQTIGRWGNFINGEAHGYTTDLPWGMTIDGRGPYHPTFFYESLWNAIGFVLLFIFVRKLKKHHGEAFFLYLSWYGLGRAFIEGLRTDSLPVGDFRISQIVAIIALAAGIILFILSRLHVIEKIQPKVQAREKKKAERYKPVYQSLYGPAQTAENNEPKQLSEGDATQSSSADDKKETEENG